MPSKDGDFDRIHQFVSYQTTVARELEQLYVKQSTLEVYFEWLDSLIERRVSEVRRSAEQTVAA